MVNQATLFPEETQEYIASLGHTLKIGDKVEWNSAGHILIGVITELKSGKCEIMTTGCRYLDEAELEAIKKKARRSYKVSPSKCFKLEPKVA